MTNLKIGILCKNFNGWQILLEQEGVPFFKINDVDNVNEFCVLIVGDEFDKDDIENIKRYLKRGGVLLCSGKFYSRLTNLSSKKVYTRYISESEDDIFTGIDLLDLYTDLYLPKFANALKTCKNEFAVFNGEYGGGYIIALPFDAGNLVLNSKTKIKSFYSTNKRLPYENVSQVSKGKLLRLISTALEHLFHKCGFPYIHKWYYPEDKPSIFAWRIDTDYANENEINLLLQLISLYKIKATLFIDVKNQEQHFAVYKNIKDHELGVHGYEHKFYEDYYKHLMNIQRAVEVFNRNNLKAESYASPFGRWNYEIGRAINHFGFEYSSEFSYDYDNLPSYPLIAGEHGTLQVPIHPICIGSLRRQGFTENSMIEYYENIIDRKYYAREPILLYHHPKDKNESIIKYIFDKINSLKISNLRMIDYARWWKKRSQNNLQLSIDTNLVKAISHEQTPNYWFHITRDSGEEAFCSFSSLIDISKLVWEKRPIPKKPPSDLIKIRRFNPWVLINRFEDNVHKILKSFR